MSEPAACCPPDSHPYLSPRKGNGHFDVVSSSALDFRIYVADSGQTCASKDIIVVFTDVYGVDSGNHQTFADALSKKTGKTVLVPDLFRSSPAMNPWFPWLLPDTMASALGFPGMLARLKMRHTKEAVMSDVSKLVVPYVRKRFGDDVTIGCVGFCFGGWVVGQCLTTDDFTWGVGVHPSFNVELLHRRSEVGLAKKIKGRVLLLPAGNDSAELQIGGGAVSILAAKYGVAEDQVCKPFLNMKHGWVTRGDGSKNDAIKQAQESVLDIIGTFVKDFE
jgi:dienelactone hydrolase